MKSALLASVPLIAFILSPPFVTPLQAQDGGSEPQSEILVLEPASGDTVKNNPVQLKGRVEGKRLQRLRIQSESLVGAVKLRDRSFRFPFFLFADADGKTLPTTLVGEGAAPAQLDLAVKPLSAVEVEELVIDMTRNINGDDPDTDQALDAVRQILDAGHPVFARILLERVNALELDARDARDAAILAVEIAVVLGDEETANNALNRVAKPDAERKQLRATGERLFHASDLALVTGLSHQLATGLLERGNLYFQEAGLLPRRLLKGY